MFTGLESAAENVGELKKIAFQEMSAARLETAQRKLPFVISYLKDLLEEGKVVVFAYHREVIEAISFRGSRSRISLRRHERQGEGRRCTGLSGRPLLLLRGPDHRRRYGDHPDRLLRRFFSRRLTGFPET